MHTPTTAQIRTAIQVLKKYGEHINHNAANLIIELPETRFGDHVAARTKVVSIDQVTRIQTVAAQLRSGATIYSNRGGSVFLIMFNTGHALPLRAEGFCVREAVAVNSANSHAI